MLETADSHDRRREKSLQPVQRTVSDGAYIRDPCAETENLTVGDHSLGPALIYVFVLVLGYSEKYGMVLDMSRMRCAPPTIERYTLDWKDCMTPRGGGGE